MRDPILVQVRRGDLVESVHHARLVVTAADGTLEESYGDVTAPMFPRSSMKPLQAVGMLRAGLDLDGELLALAAASHSGEAFHIDGARRILAGCGLSEADLQCTPDLPIDREALIAWVRDGHDQQPVAMNCSGKHAAMLRTSVRNDWPTASYRDPGHPVQRAIRAAIEDLAAEPVTATTVDGCGAPLFALSLTGLARAFGRIATADAGPERQLADAYRSFPEWASGTRRDEAALHHAVPGLVGKAGAEGVYAVGLADGRGIALKIMDGASRGRAPLMATVLQRLGLSHPTLDRHSHEPVLGHGEPVGEVTAVFDRP